MERPVVKSLIVLLSSVIAVTLLVLITRYYDSVFIGFLYPVTFLIAWYFGFRYSLISIAIMFLGSVYFVFEPYNTFKLLKGSDMFRMAVYVLTSILTAYLVGRNSENAHTLADLRTRFKRSASATNLGVWYCDLPFDRLIWDEKVKEHFWLPKDAEVDINIFYERIHPDDREMTKTAIEKSISTRGPYDIVYRTTNPQNVSQVKHIRAIGWTDYDAAGNPIRFDGMTLDNSHMKKVSSDLKDSMEVLETINAVGRNLSAELDQKKLVQQVTDAATVLSKAEFLSITSLNFRCREILMSSKLLLMESAFSGVTTSQKIRATEKIFLITECRKATYRS